MKKSIFISGLLIIILCTSSCSKCTTCTKSGGSGVRLCEKDYDSHTAYGIAVDFYSNSGYSCK